MKRFAATTSWPGRARSDFRPAILVCLSLLIVASCSRRPAPSATAPSTVEVDLTGNRVVLITPAARFELSSSGYLKASLLNNGQALSLDDPGSAGSSELVISGGKQVDDFQLDFAAAKVSEGAGRLGTRGKTVVISGRSASNPSLQKVMTIEVADEFPTLAFTTVAYKNAGSTPLLLDQVLAQRHRLNAAQ